MKNIREYLTLLEDRKDDPNISYSQDDSKVTATVSGAVSAKYTRLMQNLDRASQLADELKALQEEIKQQRREDVAALFNAEDAMCTRVIETKSVVFTLSKDPKETEAPKYKVILEELEKKLTPELITVLETLKREHVTITQKEPALRYSAKEALGEDTSSANVIAQKVLNWLPRFDQQLNAIKQAI